MDEIETETETETTMSNYLKLACSLEETCTTSLSLLLIGYGTAGKWKVVKIHDYDYSWQSQALPVFWVIGEVKSMAPTKCQMSDEEKQAKLPYAYGAMWKGQIDGKLALKISILPNWY